MNIQYLISFILTACLIYKISRLLDEINDSVQRIEYDVDKILKHTLEMRFKNDKLA